MKIRSFALGLLLAALPVSVSAQPTELFFSEYIEGSSNNKAIEIYNGTGRRSISALPATTCRCISMATPRRA